MIAASALLAAAFVKNVRVCFPERKEEQ